MDILRFLNVSVASGRHLFQEASFARGYQKGSLFFDPGLEAVGGFEIFVPCAGVANAGVAAHFVVCKSELFFEAIGNAKAFEIDLTEASLGFLRLALRGQGDDDD